MFASDFMVDEKLAKESEVYELYQSVSAHKLCILNKKLGVFNG